MRADVAASARFELRRWLVAERQVIDKDGGVGFRLQRYVWRSKPTNSPLTSRPVRCMVGQDENGQFRPATRIGIGKGANQAIETKFAIEPFASKPEAIRASRELTRDFLRMEAEVYSRGVKDRKPGQQIVKVEMDGGWSVSINAAEKPPLPSREEDVKSVVWEGPPIETDEGPNIHGVVGRTRTGEFKAGFRTVYRELGPKGRVSEVSGHYSWQETAHPLKEHAIFAARKEVQKEQGYDAAEPELRYDVAGEKPEGPSKEGCDRKFFNRLGIGGTQKKEPVQRKRSRSIDR